MCSITSRHSPLKRLIPKINQHILINVSKFFHEDTHYSFLMSDNNNNDRACYNNISKIYCAVFSLLFLFDGTEAPRNVCGVEHSSEQSDSEQREDIKSILFIYFFPSRCRREKFLCCLIFWNINDDYRHRKIRMSERKSFFMLDFFHDSYFLPGCLYFIKYIRHFGISFRQTLSSSSSPEKMLARWKISFFWINVSLIHDLWVLN